MILALDVSTSITGVSVINEEGEVVLCSAIDLRKHKDFFVKAEKIKEYLTVIKSDVKVTQVFIEQPFMFFNSGGSSAKTMAALQRFNGVVSWITYVLFEVKPQYLTAGEARRAVGIKVPRGTKAKPVVLQFVLDNDPTFEIQYTTKGNPRPESYDKADSWVIAKAGWSVWKKSLSSAEH